jgi:hypothetical protein
LTTAACRTASMIATDSTAEYGADAADDECASADAVPCRRIGR